MIDAMKQMFWHTGTQLVELIVPIVAVIMVMGLFYTALVGGRR